jgi:hypothetical protein
MPYIGKQPVIGEFVELDALTASATSDYALTRNGAAYYPETVNNLLVSINGVIQAGSTMSLINGSTLRVGATLSSSDVIDFVRVFGNVGNVVTPTDGSVTDIKIGSGAVTTAKIADDAVTSAKIADNAVVTASIADDAITLSKAADDFYRTGTWTPTFTPGSGSFNGLTMNGTYTRIGRLCHVTANILITASGNAGADLTIGNLPFTNNTASMRIAGVWRENASTGDMGQWVIVNNTKAGFLQTTSGGNPAATTGRNYLATVTYQTDDA